MPFSFGITNPPPDDDLFDGEIDSSATPETISSLSGASDAPVGLSNAQFVQQKRKMLDAVNRLRGTGYGDDYPSSLNPLLISCYPPSRSAHLDLDIPVIVVLGSQSAGKSSLIEAISGITLPRASGTCTRYAYATLACIPRTLPPNLLAGVRRNASFRNPPSRGAALSRSAWSQMRTESI